MVRRNWLEAYDYTTDKGAATLNDYARVADPFSRIGQHSVTVAINSVVRASVPRFQDALDRAALYVNGRQAAGLDAGLPCCPSIYDPAHRGAPAQAPLGIYVSGLSGAAGSIPAEG